MNGKIVAFYGAEVVNDNGQAIGSLPNKTAVGVVEPFGKPANRDGEWTKVAANGVTGWVLSAQVHAPYHGGAREGAGRKPLGDAVRVTAVLTPELVAKADELGNGNTSEGIRIALKGQGTMNAKQIQERIETLTARMDNAARKSSANPVIQERLTAEVDELWAEIQTLEAQLRTL